MKWQVDLQSERKKKGVFREQRICALRNIASNSAVYSNAETIFMVKSVEIVAAITSLMNQWKQVLEVPIRILSRFNYLFKGLPKLIMILNTQVIWNDVTKLVPQTESYADTLFFVWDYVKLMLYNKSHQFKTTWLS